MYKKQQGKVAHINTATISYLRNKMCNVLHFALFVKAGFRCSDLCSESSYSSLQNPQIPSRPDSPIGRQLTSQSPPLLLARFEVRTFLPPSPNSEPSLFSIETRHPSQWLWFLIPCLLALYAMLTALRGMLPFQPVVSKAAQGEVSGCSSDVFQPIARARLLSPESSERSPRLACALPSFQ